MPTLIFKETEACNSNCIYCDVIARKKPRTIKKDLLRRVFVCINEYLEQNPKEYFSIVWHGGEPCIVGAEFYEHVLDLEDEVCPNTKNRIEYDIQTNLTLINQRMMLKNFYSMLYDTQPCNFQELLWYSCIQTATYAAG